MPRKPKKRSQRHARVVAFGGGRNSTALVIELTKLKLFPDRILFADTGGELPETYEHVDRLSKWLTERGSPPITKVIYKNPYYKTLEEECLRNETLPARAYGSGRCSDNWKVNPQNKFCQNDPICQDAWKRGAKVERLIGIHAGETRRAKPVNGTQFITVYPLIEWGFDQAGCEAICRQAGFDPPKSSCFFCPSKSKKEIVELSIKHPELYQRAVQIEMAVHAEDNPSHFRGLGRSYSWTDVVNNHKNGLMTTDPSPEYCTTCIDW